MADERWHHDNVPAARQLRRTMTYPERVLWKVLRDRQLAGWKFRRQHPVGIYVLDFYCAGVRLAIELDGALHAAPEQRTRDEERQRLLEEDGIRFLRFSARELRDTHAEAGRTVSNDEVRRRFGFPCEGRVADCMQFAGSHCLGIVRK